MLLWVDKYIETLNKKEEEKENHVIIGKKKQEIEIRSSNAWQNET